ncbi:hydantoinase B/oxoprolinase family protein [Acuticoccus kandeliae]|uniref:hydantoinase B/oxoprolinase family protein n=1 Tax=Acuticoccus kandeliae TaxID=2073160 RepID=UPI000D3E3025|nr:hydantoinase B/oxoprolinase family protein [Acuticoccus kandeliae]
MAQDGLTRLAADIGGTFTDVVLEVSGHTHSVKVLTDHGAPENGILRGVRLVLNQAGVEAGDVDLMIHGTTLATNAIIERRGAHTALITTEGFRDVLEMAFEHRFDQYDVFITKPKPLVPRDLRFTVGERLDAKGRVLKALDDAQVERLAETLIDAAVESVAVCFLHSYANSEHERRVAQILSSCAPDLRVTLSSEVCPEIREYERFTTATANAYVQPLVAGYLERLKGAMERDGLGCPLLLMTSSGGLVSVETAARQPIRLVESGPAGGAIFAKHVAETLDLSRIVAFDMGGTTAKVCLIDEGRPTVSRSFEVDRQYFFQKGSGLPLRTPVVDMVEIGAGGGSIAELDALGGVAVGPRSAGSEPGPACYGRGGTAATVTDANVILGRIDPAHFAGGSVTLDEAASEAALHRSVGDPLSLDMMTAAFAVSETVEENMANAARLHATERGRELSNRTLIALGGSAPLHAARLAEKLGIGEVVIPAFAGVGSAVGFLRAPVSFHSVRTILTPLAAIDFASVEALMAEMDAESAEIVRDGAPGAAVTVTRSAEMRYAGQGHQITVELPDTPVAEWTVADLTERFEATYSALFNRLIKDGRIEITSWLVLSVAEMPAADRAGTAAAASTSPATAEGMRRLYDPQVSDYREVPVYLRKNLRPGHRIEGPALIVEDETSTVVTGAFDGLIEPTGAIRLTRASRAMAGAAPGGSHRITTHLLWARLESVVEEQAQALLRTAFGASTREAGDLSAGIYDVGGRMLAQAVTGTPGHVNSMAQSVGHVLAKIPAAAMEPGDVYLLNDPWQGTGHLNDIVVVTPTFHRGRHVAFFACTLHVVDIGGLGMTIASRQIYEEGLYLPVVPIVKAGIVNDWLFDIIGANVRERAQVLGDIQSEIVCNELGGRRLSAMMDEFGLDDLVALWEEILERSRKAALAEIAKLPFGTWHNEMTIDGIAEPITLKAAMTISETGIDVDFSGTSGRVDHGINVPLSYTQAYAAFGIKCLVMPAIPNNAATLSTMRITAPEHSILNALPPAPVQGRGTVGQMLPDVMFGCLSAPLAGRVPAEGTSCLWNLSMSGGLGRVDARMAELAGATPFMATGLHSGGTGARPTQDGMSATAFPSGVRAVPVEVTESAAPILVRRKEYRPDSGGVGTFRGGLGQIMEVASAEAKPFSLNMNYDRVLHPPRGRNGGGAGLTGRVHFASGAVPPGNGKGKITIPPADSVIVEMPGGGGFGDPLERDPALVAQDVRAGFVSVAAAREHYGVIVTASGDVDDRATVLCRADLRSGVERGDAA